MLFTKWRNMLAQICQFLAVDSSNFPINEHIIIGNRSREGGFLIHYFLNLCQKQNRPVCFVGLSQSFSHYNTVAQKLGTNLLFARDENKNLIFIEGLQLLNECADRSSLSNKKSTVNPFLQLLNGDSTAFIELISSSVDKLAQAENTVSYAPVVIIDDLSILVSAGLTSQETILLVNSIHEIVTQKSVKGSLITLSQLEEEKEIDEVWAFLSHLSTLKIEVSDLKSGYCKDVHGQMQIQWQDSFLKPRQFVIKHTQFKLSDKSIELFASGMSSAVL